MKKIILIVILLSCFITVGVKAGDNDAKIDINYLDSVYGNFVIGDLFYWNQIGITTANNKLAYCIEPGKWINENIYDSYTDFQIKNLNDTKKHTLELYAYYGYSYPNHNTTKYYLATQELIWRFLGINEMYWSTDAVHKGERINVENEKKIINDLMSKHNDLPSFHNKIVEAVSGQTIDLLDTNNVFEKFESIGSVSQAFSTSGNLLKIFPKKVGNSTMKFIKYPNEYKTSFIYTKNDSQAVVTLGLSNKIYSQVNVKVKGFNFNLHKKDRINNSNIPSNEGSLKGAVYKLSNGLDYDEEIVTDELGDGTLNDVPADNYTLKEIKASKGYKIDPKEYKVTIEDHTNLEVEMNVFEDVITNDIELIKVFSNGETGLVKPEINISFSIYDENNTFIKQITTDSKGRAKTTLNYGTYTIKQVNTAPDYERVEDFTIFVDENSGEPLEYILSDNLIDSKIKIIKVDEFDKPIKEAGIQFKIKNMDTNEYVEQKIIYPEEKIISVFETDKDGQVITPYPLKAGNYQVEEIRPPVGYIVNNQHYQFSINEDTELVEDDLGKVLTIYLKNYKPQGRVTINKTGNKRIWEIDTYGEYYVKTIFEPLTGVEFELISNEDIKNNGDLVYKKGTIIEKLTTINGYAYSDLLPLGNYCIIETKSLDGYSIKNDKDCFELKYKDYKTTLITKEIKIVNELFNTHVEISKTGEEMIDIINSKGVYKEIPLSNVKFGLFNKEEMIINEKVIKAGTQLIEDTTDELGKINLYELPAMHYYIKELSTDKNHLIDLTNYDINMTENNNFHQIKINNKKKRSNVLVSKIDSKTKAPLIGAVFKLGAEGSEEKWKGATNNKGTILLEDIAYGDYFIDEIKAPDGYQQLKNKISFKVDKDSIIKLEVENIKYAMPNTSTDTRIKIYFLIGCTTICLLGIIITLITRKKGYE